MQKTKYCPRCGEEKTAEEFYINEKQPSGLSSYCRGCTREWQKERYARGKVKKRKQSPEYYKKYYREHREAIALRRAEYQRNHKELVKKWHKAYREKHREQIREASREYRAKHRDGIRSASLARLHGDPLHKERERCRCVIRGLWRREHNKNISSASSLIGCSPASFKQHLLRTWKDRYGTDYAGEKCEVDHIVPLATGKSVEEIRELCNYANLQLLTPEDNARKHVSLE